MTVSHKQLRKFIIGAAIGTLIGITLYRTNRKIKIINSRHLSSTLGWANKIKFALDQIQEWKKTENNHRKWSLINGVAGGIQGSGTIIIAFF